jgi:2-polyprenyl-3-methyl-5-hydroxy-6-metoxy-1,4-benzoquinol methylase
MPHVAVQHNESSLRRAARLFARPLLSPIDGRVADVNRRIESARQAAERQTAVLEQLVGKFQTIESFVRSSTEVSSYIGVELRRIQETLDSVQEHTQDEYYRMRLAGARELSLNHLDGTLAEVINRANGIHGVYAQAGLFFNQPVLVALSEGAAKIVLVTERIVEVPFAMAALRRLHQGARILDVGSAESTFPLSAASLGYEVTAIDPRPLAYAHPNLTHVTSTLEAWQPPRGLFAAAFLISTIEHVGLGAYGEQAYGSPEHGVGADRGLLDRVRGLLTPEGMLVLTAPYGAREITELERIYDEQSFTTLLEGWEVLERKLVVRRDARVWEPTDNVEPGDRGVVMVIAQPRR